MPLIPRLHTFDSWIEYRDYRLLWVGNFCANSAQWLQLLTVGWLVRSLTEGSPSSSLLVVTVGGLSTLPGLLVGPWGGVLGDRIDRRKLIMGIQSFMAVLAFSSIRFRRLLCWRMVMEKRTSPWWFRPGR